MYSFIAFAWESKSGAAQSAMTEALRSRFQRTRWELVINTAGLLVYQRGGHASACGACELVGNVGTVLGTIFRRNGDGSSKRALTLPEAEATSIATSGGRVLVERFWGRYVAIVGPQKGHEGFILRDPSGSLPCFTTRWRGLRVWFSNIEDCVELGVGDFSIDWNYIETHVAFRGVLTCETGIDGLRELAPGHADQLAASTPASVAYWDPFSISESLPLEHFESAAAELRRATLECVAAWASCYPNVIHTLSGGLDSSIVAAALACTRPKPVVTCVNYFTDIAEGDERLYARVAAQKSGYELIEVQRQPQDIRLDKVLTLARSAKPSAYFYYIEHGGYESTLATEYHASAIFHGGGGDGLFYQTRADLSVADYLQKYGLTRDLIAVAFDAARNEGSSLLSALTKAVANQSKAARVRLLREQTRIVKLANQELAQSKLGALDAQFSDEVLKRIPTGKLWHILSTGVPPYFYDPFNEPTAVERVPPLVSQPIIEACLRTPTYTLVKNGWNRSVARHAFAAELPDEILNRRGKGSISHHVRQVGESNLQFIREFLLDGELVRRNILDREGLERCLSPDNALNGALFSELEDHISTEAWLRAWDSRRSISVAA